MLVWSVGELLWDIFADQERLGGAPLNFCANLQRLGDSAKLLSGVGTDERGRRALGQMRTFGLVTDGVCQVEHLPTGIATIGNGANGEPTFVIPRPAAFDGVSLDPAIFTNMGVLGVDWLYFGTLVQTHSAVERFTSDLARHLPGARGFYDINLRAGHWNLPLVQRLSRLATVIKLNLCEAETLFHLTCAGTTFTVENFCEEWAETYHVDVICVTLGAAGCLIFDKGNVLGVAGFEVAVCDTIGAGDAFAAAFLHGYHRRWPLAEVAIFANALGAIVSGGQGATPNWTIEEVRSLATLTNQTAGVRGGGTPKVFVEPNCR